MISCLLTLVALFLTGVGLGDSPLVILSLCSLVLFFVISFLLVSSCSCFLVFFFFFCSLLYTLCAAFVFLRFFNIIFLLIKKKKKILMCGDRSNIPCLLKLLYLAYCKSQNLKE